MTETKQNSLSTIIKANLNHDDVKRLAFDLFDLKVVNLIELNGYDDKNYRLFVENHEPEKKSYVLKVINSLDSQNEKLIEAQSLLLEHLGRKQICCPTPILNKEGHFLKKIKLDRAEHVVRLLEYIDGNILHNVECNPHLLYEVGQFAARMDNAMGDFEHDAFNTCDSIWKMESVPRLELYLGAIKDQADKELVTAVINEFKNRVLPISKTLNSGLIHGDFNEQNIVVQRQENSSEYKIKAVLDFGDCHRSCYLFELAVTMAYMILQARDIRAGAYVLAGYKSIKKVPEKEYSLLALCIAARLTQSLVLGTYSIMQDPGNAYILVTAKEGWRTLKELRRISEAQVLREWRDISDHFFVEL